MNRGASKRPVFLDDDDRHGFIRLLADSAARTQVEVHGYCLMGNHFHLLVHTPFGNMAEMMRLLSGRYARFFNDRWGRDGALCRGRYRSIVVDSERYLLAVSRYIHRNPLAFWDRSLSRYQWSSYPAFLAHRPCPDWLVTDTVLRLANSRRDYRAIVESSMQSDVDRLYESRRPPRVLGSEQFQSAVMKLRDR